MMKYLFTTVFITVIAANCFAQAEQSTMEPEGLFSIRNTLWTIANSGIAGGEKDYLGFSASSIYFCSSETECENIPGSVIFDLMFISIFQGGDVGININGFAIPLLGVGSYKMWFGSSSTFSLIFKSVDPWYL